MSYTASRVQSLRHHWKIPCHQPSGQQPEGELLNVTAAARQLGIAPSTLLRWLDDGFVAGEQVTPGAPWRIRLTGDTPPRRSASPGRPYCRRSSAASYAPS
jgi:transposase-like protein